MDIIELSGIFYESAKALKARLHIAEMTLNRYMKKGLPRPIRVGGRRFFAREMVDKWLAQKWK
jgi:predicted site-specific integrase-resolvase